MHTYRRTLVRLIALTYLGIGPAANAQTLLFSENFDGPTIDSDWTVITNPPHIDIDAGRLRSSENGQVLNSVAAYSGGLRIEADVEKTGIRNHTQWDLAIGLINAAGETALGTVRFDQDEMDAVGTGSHPGAINDPVTIPSLPGISPNKGHVIFTFENSEVNFSFTNTLGETLVAPTKSIPLDGPHRLFINLAAHPDSPRYLDNIRVYGLPVPEPSCFLLVAAAVLAASGRRARF
ncbi:MAG: hypothetical protein KDA61_07680 [Planctomycetales bacterium]|nr:hypothetical protein [Planctomycetales bacterium]